MLYFNALENSLFLYMQDVVKRIENVQTDAGSHPVQKVEITQSGAMDVPQPFEVTKDEVTA